MKLYFLPGACSLSPHIALREAGLTFEIDKVDRKSGMTASGKNYRSINPPGYVPALQLDNGEILTEGPAIVQYVADQAPEKKLAPPAGTMDRYRLQSWLNFIATEIHRGFTPLFNPAIPDEAKAAFKERLIQRIGYVNECLTGRDYLMGNQMTVADIYLFVTMTWTKPMKIDLTPFPNVAAFVVRMAARPAVQAALKAEGLAA
jgi:glutathione S-transferase